ncbi:MAG TPA: hypothetical protein VG735_12325 [Caulobacterales bacterium]|nr:hypothetical protein [Caulobacterales bacterium]
MSLFYAPPVSIEPLADSRFIFVWRCFEFARGVLGRQPHCEDNVLPELLFQFIGRHLPPSNFKRAAIFPCARVSAAETPEGTRRLRAFAFLRANKSFEGRRPCQVCAISFASSAVIGCNAASREKGTATRPRDGATRSN